MGDYCSAVLTRHRVLVAAHDIAQVLRVQLRRKRSRAHHVHEHYGQLAALGLGADGTVAGGILVWCRLGIGFKLTDRREQLAPGTQCDPYLPQVIFSDMRERV